MAKPSIYIESSVISYLAARPSREVIKQSRQLISYDFWLWARDACDCCVSALTRDEIGRGDAQAAAQRLAFFGECRVLEIPSDAQLLASALIAHNAIPPTEPEDAAHIAIATLSKMKYIASWNFAHMVGIASKRKLERTIEQLGYDVPILATPEEILLESNP